MKRFIRIATIVPMLVAATSCADLTETNISPNTLTANEVSTKFVLTQVLTSSAKQYTNVAYGGSASVAVTLEAMQYLQRDFLESSVLNTFLWFNQAWSDEYYKPITNADYLGQRAAGEQDEAFYKAVSLVMKSFWFGYLTSAWGDIPYSEAMKAESGNFKPKYDEQKQIFKGILADLEMANQLLSTATVSSVTAPADVMFGGNLTKWRKFTNALHLKMLMHLSEKTADMQAIGVDVKGEFNKIASNATQYPLMTSSADNASVAFPGTSGADSWPGGPLNWVTRDAFYRRKPAATIINTLKAANDPRLTVWIRPVDVQTVVKDVGADEKFVLDTDGKVRRYIRTYTAGTDTSRYVGLPVAMANPDAFNGNTATARATVKALSASIYVNAASNPMTSYLADIYQKDKDPLVKAVLLSAAETNFILAEGAARGWTNGSAPALYKAGISESLAQYAIANGDRKVYNTRTHALQAFDLSVFLAEAEKAYTVASDKLEPILTQRWIANWMNGDSWFAWRRTGYPNLGKNIIAGTRGDKIPLRLGYGDDEKNYNQANVTDAISRLDSKTDDQWAKMWLLQGTGKPW